MYNVKGKHFKTLESAYNHCKECQYNPIKNIEPLDSHDKHYIYLKEEGFTEDHIKKVLQSDYNRLITPSYKTLMG